MLARSPVTEACSASAAAMAPDVQASVPLRYSTAKPVSSDDSSVQVTETDVEPVAETATPDGAAGEPRAATDATFDGDERPFVECFANTRNS